MAIPVGDDRLALLVIPSSLVVRRAVKAASGRSSRVGRLDDATFVLASRLVSLLLEADGRGTTDSHLAASLLSLLCQVPGERLADSPSEVDALEFVGPQVRQRSKRGDVVAVPAPSGASISP
jgi:hypothetical protein